MKTHSENTPSVLIHEDTPTYGLWLVLVLGGTLFMTLFFAIALFWINPPVAWIMIGVTLFNALLFHAVCVRKYQIYSDRIRIELGRPFAFEIALNTIKEARVASGRKAFVYIGLRFATTTANTVEILRDGKASIIISPGDREQFLEQLNSALKT